jgi:hypothetical protein
MTLRSHGAQGNDTRVSRDQAEPEKGGATGPTSVRRENDRMGETSRTSVRFPALSNVRRWYKLEVRNCASYDRLRLIWRID